MRTHVTTKHSTKPERIVAEHLKTSHVPFRHRVKMLNREIDFLIDERLAVEIDGHDQVRDKNKVILEAGYSILHLSNRQVFSGEYKLILKTWLQHLKIAQD